MHAAGFEPMIIQSKYLVGATPDYQPKKRTLIRNYFTALVLLLVINARRI